MTLISLVLHTNCNALIVGVDDDILRETLNFVRGTCKNHV